MADQNERAFQKQPKVFLAGKRDKSKGPGKGGNRYWKNVGLGFKTPREAIEGTYIDKKCPFTGTVSIRGRILTGTVYRAKMTRTITVRRDYLHFVKKYQRTASLRILSCLSQLHWPVSKELDFVMAEYIQLHGYSLPKYESSDHSRVQGSMSAGGERA